MELPNVSADQCRGSLEDRKKEIAFDVCPWSTAVRTAVTNVVLVDASTLIIIHRLLHDKDHSKRPRVILPDEKPDFPHGRGRKVWQTFLFY